MSQTRGRSRIFTFSAIEAEGLHQGVFASQEETWRPGGADKPFVIQAFKTDTPDALQTAIAHSETYFKNVGAKPHPKFVLEYTARLPDPVWRVYWGDSVSAAQWSVFIDLDDGTVRGPIRTDTLRLYGESRATGLTFGIEPAASGLNCLSPGAPGTRSRSADRRQNSRIRIFQASMHSSLEISRVRRS